MKKQTTKAPPKTAPVPKRTCTKCMRSLPLSKFGVQKGKIDNRPGRKVRDQINSRCRSCDVGRAPSRRWPIEAAVKATRIEERISLGSALTSALGLERNPLPLVIKPKRKRRAKATAKRKAN